MPASDLISRSLAAHVGNRCMQAMDLISTGNLDLAKKALADLARYVWKFAESEEEDRARARRESSR